MLRGRGFMGRCRLLERLRVEEGEDSPEEFLYRLCYMERG